MKTLLNPSKDTILVSHLNIWAIAHDQKQKCWKPIEPHTYELTLGWMSPEGHVSVALAPTSDQVRAMLKGEFTGELALSDDGEQRVVSTAGGAVEVYSLHLNSVYLEGFHEGGYAVRLIGEACDLDLDLNLSPHLSYVCVNCLDQEFADAMIADISSELGLEDPEYGIFEDDEDGTVTGTVYLSERPETQELSADYYDPRDSLGPVVITDYEDLEFGLRIETEQWCDRRQAWFYGQETFLNLNLDIRVDETSGEDGALAPSLDIALPVEFPAWADIEGVVLDEENSAIEAWYGNDAPELEDNRFEFLTEGKFRWTAQIETESFTCESSLGETPKVTIKVKALDDLEKLVRMAWPAQAERGFKVVEQEDVDYGTQMPEDRRHWLKLSLELK